MAVSESMYGSITSYVSSSAYYGFVPQNIQQPGNFSSCWDANVNMKETSNGNRQHGAMETDDDTCDVDLVNNYCVIPEALRGISPAVYSNYLESQNPAPGFGALDRQPRQDAARHRNRKRNNHGELMSIEPDQLKRLRKGSGNGRTYHGRGISKDGGLAEVHYKSSRFCISRGERYREEEDSAVVEGCCWAAGNHSIIVNQDDKRKDLLLNGNSKLSGIGDVEYERMLLETHGCSAYHHQRFQSNNGIGESEF